MVNTILRKKVVLSAVLAILLLISLIPVLNKTAFENAVFSRVDEKATGFIDDALKRALGAYALARGLNMVISIIQESTVSVQPLGLGVTAALGQVLDPVNDLIERFSWVMLVSLTSLGVQRLLIEIGPWVSLNILLIPALLLWLAGLWLKGRLSWNLSSAGKKLLFAAIVLRFCVPATVMLNEQIYLHFLSEKYESAYTEIERGRERLEELDPLSSSGESDYADGEKSWFGRMSDSFKAAGNIDKWKGKLLELKEKAADMLDYLIRMIVIFVLGSILLPIAFLWGLIQIFRVLLGGFGVAALEALVREKIVPDKAAS